MCVEGLRAIPLGCSDCYDKDNVPEAERGGLAEQAVVAGQGAGPARAGRGPGGGRAGAAVAAHPRTGGGGTDPRSVPARSVPSGGAQSPWVRSASPASVTR